MKSRIVILSLLLFSQALFAQQREMMIVNGETLVGKVINGESIREVIGNVIITQGDVRITCSKAIQYLARNQAELIGNVVVTQDSVTINTESGFYYGDSKIAYSSVGVSLFDGHVNLNADTGYYYFDEKRAKFINKVRLEDPVTRMESDRLTYFNDEDKAVAAGRVKVQDSTSVLFADSLVHYRNTKITFAYSNISIYDPKNRLAIFADNLEDYKQIKYSKIFDNPILVQIDTTANGEPDTLVISSRLMEAFDDSVKRLVATDSVRISRSGFASVNDFTVFYQNKDHLFTFRPPEKSTPPVLWNENTQLIGDTINIFLEENRMKELLLNSNASIISTNQNFPLKYDQLSGREIKMSFGKEGLQKTEAAGSVLSIYFLFEEGEPNGLLKSSSERTIIYFQDNEVTDVKFYGNPATEYHPENLIRGKDREFTIPSFIIYENRPDKNSVLRDRKKLIYSKMEELNESGK